MTIIQRFNKGVNWFFTKVLDIKNRTLLITTIIALILLLFKPTISNLIFQVALENYTFFESTITNNVILIFLLFLTSIYLYWRIKIQNKAPNKYRLINSLVCVLLIYLPYRLNIYYVDQWHFNPMHGANFIKYTDVIILILLTVTLKFTKKAPAASENNYYFIEDNIKTFDNIDIFKRENFATDIAYRIEGTNTINSFAVGIKGKWGNGKSVLLNQIDLVLSKKIIKIHFNPWRVKDDVVLIEDFFKTIITQLNPFAPKLSTQIENYYKSLLELDSNLLFKFLKPTLEMFYPTETIEKQFKEIKETLNELNLKIVIFIDDLDRLKSNELLEVLKIVRNTMNFPNTFFIVAYDSEYVINSLKHENIYSPETYMEKIFQLEIPLPSFPNEIIKNTLVQLLTKNMIEDEKNKIITIINSLHQAQKGFGKEEEIYPIINDFINNLRDVIRFVNLINLTFNAKKEEIEWTEFIILELIKLKEPKTYEEIEQIYRHSKFSSFLIINNVPSSNELYLEFVESEENERKLGKRTHSALSFLYNRDVPVRDMRSIIFPNNGLFYFSNDNFNRISIREFRIGRKNGFDNLKISMDKWMKDGQSKELISILDKINFYENRDDFETVIKACFYVIKETPEYWRLRIFDKLSNVDLLMSRYYKDPVDYKKFIVSIINNGAYPYEFESAILYDLQDLAIRNKNFTDIINQDELKILQFGLFEKYCNNPLTTQITTTSFSLYHNNKDYVDSEGNVVLSLKASSLFRNLISKYPYDYIEDIIYPFSPSSETYILKPFVDQTFEGYENFDTFLVTLKNTKTVLEVKTFLKKYKLNNYKPVQFRRNSAQLFSSTECIFRGSPSFPDIQKNINVITYKHVGLENIRKKNSNFIYADWIAHTQEISSEEATKGGNYLIEYNFNLDFDMAEIQHCILYAQVDDQCTLKLNESEIKSANGGTSEVLFGCNSFLVNGKNKMEFNVKNNSAIENGHKPSRVLTYHDNPYGLIFYLDIVFNSPPINNSLPFDPNDIIL